METITFALIDLALIMGTRKTVITTNTVNWETKTAPLAIKLKNKANYIIQNYEQNSVRDELFDCIKKHYDKLT